MDGYYVANDEGRKLLFISLGKEIRLFDDLTSVSLCDRPIGMAKETNSS